MPHRSCDAAHRRRGRIEAMLVAVAEQEFPGRDEMLGGDRRAGARRSLDDRLRNAVDEAEMFDCSSCRCGGSPEAVASRAPSRRLSPARASSATSASSIFRTCRIADDHRVHRFGGRAPLPVLRRAFADIVEDAASRGAAHALAERHGKFAQRIVVGVALQPKAPQAVRSESDHHRPLRRDAFAEACPGGDEFQPGLPLGASQGLPGSGQPACAHAPGSRRR